MLLQHFGSLGSRWRASPASLFRPHCTWRLRPASQSTSVRLVPAGAGRTTFATSEALVQSCVFASWLTLWFSFSYNHSFPGMPPTRVCTLCQHEFFTHSLAAGGALVELHCTMCPCRAKAEHMQHAGPMIGVACTQCKHGETFHKKVVPSAAPPMMLYAQQQPQYAVRRP